MPPAAHRRLFPPNLAAKGRIIRGGCAVALIAAALATWSVHRGLGIALAAGGAFMLFEALRGWCVLRACRLKTPF